MLQELDHLWNCIQRGLGVALRRAAEVLGHAADRVLDLAEPCGDDLRPACEVAGVRIVQMLKPIGKVGLLETMHHILHHGLRGPYPVVLP